MLIQAHVRMLKPRRAFMKHAAHLYEKRRKAEYPAHGLAVDHLRVADIDPALAPEWMRPGLTPAEE